MNTVHGDHTLPCGSCGAPGAVTTGQAVFHGGLRWHRSTFCACCGCVMEEDGLGFPPAELRGFLLRWGGTWRLEVDAKDRMAAAKTVRGACGLPLARMAAILRGEAPVYEGTATEVEWIRQALQAAGAGESAGVSAVRQPDRWEE